MLQCVCFKCIKSFAELQTRETLTKSKILSVIYVHLLLFPYWEGVAVNFLDIYKFDLIIYIKNESSFATVLVFLRDHTQLADMSTTNFHFKTILNSVILLLVSFFTYKHITKITIQTYFYCGKQIQPREKINIFFKIELNYLIIIATTKAWV